MKLNRRLIKYSILQIEVHRRRLDELSQNRNRDKDSFDRWIEAYKAWCQFEHPIVILWDRAYLAQALEGDRGVIEDCLLYLEVDPWHFRSGYLKEELIRVLKKCPLLERDITRVHRLILNICRGQDRREFRRFCALARRFWTKDFEQQVEQHRALYDRKSHGKFSYLLDFCHTH